MKMQPQTRAGISAHAEHLRSDLVVVMELVGENAVQTWLVISFSFPLLIYCRLLVLVLLVLVFPLLLPLPLPLPPV